MPGPRTPLTTQGGNKMNILRYKFHAVLAAGALTLGLSAFATVAAAAGPGADTCVKCHADEVATYSQSIHGAKGCARSVASKGECTACHGDATEHVAKKGKSPMKSPGKKSMSAEESSGTCLACHKSDSTRSHWAGSTHQTRDVACSACHTVHAKDKVMVKLTQPDVCFACHKTQRAELNRPSRHPILEGKVSCAHCHNVHGSYGKKLGKKDYTV